MPNFNTRQGFGLPFVGRATVGTALQLNTINGSVHSDADTFFDGELSATEVLGSLHTDPDSFFDAIVNNEQQITGSKLGDSISVLDSTISSDPVIQTSHTISIPDGSNTVGRLVLVTISANDSPSFSFPAGWTELLDTSISMVALGISYRVIDGTEGFSGENDTITVTTSTSQHVAYISYLIEIFDTTPNIELSSTVTGMSTSPDPGSIAPSTGFDNYLNIAVQGHDAGTTSTTGFPTNFINNQTESVGNLIEGCGIAGSHLIKTDSSQDPSAFTITQVRDWIAVTVSIRSTEIPSEDKFFGGAMFSNIEGSLFTNVNVFNQGTIYHGVGVSLSQREITGYSEENPKPYTLSKGDNNWIAITIAVKG